MDMANTASVAPESPYAAELKRGPKLRFTPAVEAEYVRAQLAQNRTLIVTTCLFATFLIGLRGLEQALGGYWGGRLPIEFGLVFSGSALLAGIACSTAFERLYLQWAAIIVPARNAIIAAQIAGASAHGQTDMVMTLPLLLIGPFFFLGLRFQTALISGVLSVGTFTAYANFIHLVPLASSRASALLSMCLVVCSIAARNIEQRSRKSFLETQLIAELAQHDTLTGTKNRRIFDEHLTRLWSKATEDNRTVAILLIDVDHFKAYNDNYGHQAGDSALRLVAQAMQTHVSRPFELLARYGGEEFVAVFYDVDVKEAKAAAERIRGSVEDLAVEHRGSQAYARLTISVGVAIVEPIHGRDSRGALQLADQALYQAKVKGRNRVEVMNDVYYRMLVTGIFSKESAQEAE